MPKIKAQSVELHRQNQLQVLVDSSIALIIKNGFHSLKFEDVAKKSKISRTTVYEYFNSKEDIAIAIAKLEIPKWKEKICSEIKSEKSPSLQLKKFISTQLQMIESGQHQAPFILMKSELSPKTMQHIGHLHEELALVLKPIIEAIGGDKKSKDLPFIWGAIASAGHMIEHGSNVGETTESLYQFILSAIKK